MEYTARGSVERRKELRQVLGSSPSPMYTLNGKPAGEEKKREKSNNTNWMSRI